MSKHVQANIMLLLITVIWGASFVLIKNSQDAMSAFTFLSLRFSIAIFTLIIIFHKNIITLSQKTLLCGCTIGSILFLSMLFQVYGIRYTTASNSAFITGISVVLVPIFLAITAKIKLNLSTILGVFVSFVGLFFMSGGMKLNFNFGDFLTLLSAICFAYQIILVDKFTKIHDPILLAICQIGFCAILYNLILGLKMLRFRKWESLNLNSTIIFNLIIVGVFCTAIGFLVQIIFQKHTSATSTALIFAAEPVFGAIFAMLIPDSKGATESMNFIQGLGGILILFGILMSEFKLLNLKKISIWGE